MGEPPEQPKTVEPEPERSDQLDLGFNAAFVGMSSGIHVEPRVLHINPDQICKVKSIIYVTNVSSVRQYIKFTSTFAPSFFMRLVNSLEPGQTIAQEVSVINLDFQQALNEAVINVYYAAVPTENLRLKNDGVRKISIDIERKAYGRRRVRSTRGRASRRRSPSVRKSLIDPGPQEPIRRRPADDAKPVAEFRATQQPNDKPRTEQDELKDL